MSLGVSPVFMNAFKHRPLAVYEYFNGCLLSRVSGVRISAGSPTFTPCNIKLCGVFAHNKNFLLIFFIFFENYKRPFSAKTNRLSVSLDVSPIKKGAVFRPPLFNASQRTRNMQRACRLPHPYHQAMPLPYRHRSRSCLRHAS